MVTQMQHGGFWREIAWSPGRQREKKQQQYQVRLNFKVFTDVDDRERAKALDKKQRRTILLEEKQENWWCENEKWQWSAK